MSSRGNGSDKGSDSSVGWLSEVCGEKLTFLGPREVVAAKSACGTLAAATFCIEDGGGSACAPQEMDLFSCLQYFRRMSIMALIPSRAMGEDCCARLKMRHASRTSCFLFSAKMSSQLKQTS